MRRVLYLSHPEVRIDPAIPVPDSSLSGLGRARIGAALNRGWPGPGWTILSSPETKARETAALLAAATGDPVGIHAGMAEVDRSSTGYVPHARHEELADALFADPARGPEGWESAAAAQARIVAAYRASLAETPGDLLLVGHGAVGTFLRLHLAGLPIARVHDQPCGGCVWRFTPDMPDQPPTPWQRLEETA
ncbi:histidine phosphatase family protein [Szabonella alba]|uniref:Histidine phosphatase family protein n=1 Tax=Szabonella alba TaxID=2804194 RepID=A0A8K0VBS3_9RHOB|nr:histidine phosphatase family protein [Szabonella alba]MBL4917338.1 histidine phosphatase family protein [Szabonella alba]